MIVVGFKLTYVTIGCEVPLKVTVALFKLPAVAVIVTSVPTGPDAGVSVLLATGQSPVPSTFKIYGFSPPVASLLAIEMVADLNPRKVGVNATVKVAVPPGTTVNEVAAETLKSPIFPADTTGLDNVKLRVPVLRMVYVFVGEVTPITCAAKRVS